MSHPDIQRRTMSTNLSAGISGQAVLTGKLAIVTGSSRGKYYSDHIREEPGVNIEAGIGAAVVTNLASKGCSVVVNYTSESSASKAKDLAEKLQNDFGVTILAVQADMGSEGGPARVIEFAKTHFQHPKTGKFQIDIIVNNAGVYGGGPLGQDSREEFYRVNNVNVLGPLMLVSAALPYLPNDRSGRIVNISSISATAGLAGQSIYGGTKGALDSMTRVWSRELAERATVNSVNPGPVATDMLSGAPDEVLEVLAPWNKITPLATTREGIDDKEIIEKAKVGGGRPAYDHEIAGTVAMLCSPDAGWTTGSVICANGGMKFSY